jgi:hypothetical protein
MPYSPSVVRRIRRELRLMQQLKAEEERRKTEAAEAASLKARLEAENERLRLEAMEMAKAEERWQERWNTQIALWKAEKEAETLPAVKQPWEEPGVLESAPPPPPAEPEPPPEPPPRKRGRPPKVKPVVASVPKAEAGLVQLALTQPHYINGDKFGPGQVWVARDVADLLLEQESRARQVEDHTMDREPAARIIVSRGRTVKVPNELFEQAMNSLTFNF